MPFGKSRRSDRIGWRWWLEKGCGEEVEAAGRGGGRRRRRLTGGEQGGGMLGGGRAPGEELGTLTGEERMEGEGRRKIRWRWR